MTKQETTTIRNRLKQYLDCPNEVDSRDDAEIARIYTVLAGLCDNKVVGQFARCIVLHQTYTNNRRK